MKRGRPFEPGNKLGRGRPRGSRNKKTLLAQALLEDCGTAIVRAAVRLALGGDAPMLRTLLGYVVARPKELPVKTGPLRMGTSEELSQTFAATMKKVSAGALTLGQGREIAALIDSSRQLLQTQEFEDRLCSVEQLCRADQEAPLQPS